MGSQKQGRPERPRVEREPNPRWSQTMREDTTTGTSGSRMSAGRLQTARERAGWQGEREREIYIAQLMELRQWLKAGRYDLPWQHLDKVISKWTPKGGPRAVRYGGRRKGQRTETIWCNDRPIREHDLHDDRQAKHRDQLRSEVRADAKIQRRTDHVRMVWRSGKKVLRLDDNFQPYYEDARRSESVVTKAEVEAEVKVREKRSQYWAPEGWSPNATPQDKRTGSMARRANCDPAASEFYRRCEVFSQR